MKRLFASSVLAALPLLGVNSAFAQQSIPSGSSVITQWGFNNLSPASPLSIGAGTYNNHAVSGVGSTTGPATGLALLVSGNYPANAFGAANDNNVAAGNNGYATMNNSQPTDASGQGVEFHVSTAGATNVGFELDLMPGSRTSKYWQVYYTSDGSTWQPAPAGGTGGSAASVNGTNMTVSSSGLVTITSIPSGIISTTMSNTGHWVNGLSYQFPVGGAWENSSSFGVGLFEIYNPFQSNTAASDYGFVSALAGTNSTDTTTGYIRGSASGGTQRLDMVTVSGVVPEPTALMLLPLAGLFMRRRK